jgi:intracellular sulfur oxidation DsrE/DsrF family protein
VAAPLAGALLLALLLAVPPAAAQGEDLLLARIQLHTAGELYDALRRARELLLAGRVESGGGEPALFVLHGPEVHALLRRNYREHQALVDLAASLSALGVVEIRACETWMGGNRIDPAELYPFVGTVPNGPAEERRLLEEAQYVYF